MKKKKLLSFAIAAALSCSLFSAVPVVSQAAGTTGDPMYRLYNPNSGEHFYTKNSGEKDILASSGWTYEGIAWTAPTSSNTPVYRLYNPNSGEHHYTTGKVEKDYLVSIGWNDEGIGWYSDDSDGTPLYRLYNPNATGQYEAGAHHYTKDVNERNSLVAVGWNDEGIGWYGLYENSAVDEELLLAKDLGLIGEGLPAPSAKLLCSEFGEMLKKVIARADPSKVSEWQQLAAKVLGSGNYMEMDDAMLSLYEAACVLDIGAQGTLYWLERFNAEGEEAKPFTPDENLFANAHETAPFEGNYLTPSGWDYITSARFFCLGFSSSQNSQPFFGRMNASDGYSALLTVEEGARAAVRLYYNYLDYYRNGFAISDQSVDWEEPLLSEAKAQRDRILNSKTEIVKSDTYIQGKTYTGNAYFVSNSGNDANDGLSPKTPWATFEKVSKASLKKGDIVFFERGGTWRGHIDIQPGVTYSAYGEGPKPIWTSSPLDAADPSQWTYYGKSSDGGKIWKYNEDISECGILILNDEFVARKSYALWDGSRFLNEKAQEQYILEDELFLDGMFCSLEDLSGVTLPCYPWKDGRKGPLYFRCDKGNPGDVYDTIEMATSNDLTSVKGDYVTYDNICFRCSSSTGIDAQGNNYIHIQNCESCWCGGGINTLDHEQGRVCYNVSGGGMLLFGEHLTAINNYVHDCENKGIAIVTNYESHRTFDRTDIHVEGNVVERCGVGAYTTTERYQNEVGKFEDILFKDNYFLKCGYGWRMFHTIWTQNGYGSRGERQMSVVFKDLQKTGEVLFQNNLFYEPANAFLEINLTPPADPARDRGTMRGNTYVQREGLFAYNYSRAYYDRPNEGFSRVVTADPAYNERVVREVIGDAEGIFILNPMR